MTSETLQTSSRSTSGTTNAGLSGATPLHSKAEDNLKFIREAMEGASAFTAISGLGLVGAGCLGLVASLAQGLVTEPGTRGEILLWLATLAIAFGFSTWMTSRKARRENTSIWSANGKKLLYAFTPTMFVGGLITLYCLINLPAGFALPAFWLSLYGAAIMTASAYSAIPIRVMGAAFIALGMTAFFSPVPGWLLMATGFGGLHIITGLKIWRHHGG